jgi:hypothetical protein
MGNSQTNRFVQVCRHTDQKEQVPEPPKSGLRSEVNCLVYLRREGKRREIL